MAAFPRVTPKMPKGETEALIAELKEISRVARMDRADFGSAGVGLASSDNCTSFIREQTRIWRNSWIISPLDVLIERYEQALEDQKKGGK